MGKERTHALGYGPHLDDEFSSQVIRKDEFSGRYFSRGALMGIVIVLYVIRECAPENERSNEGHSQNSGYQSHGVFLSVTTIVLAQTSVFGCQTAFS